MTRMIYLLFDERLSRPLRSYHLHVVLRKAGAAMCWHYGIVSVQKLPTMYGLARSCVGLQIKVPAVRAVEGSQLGIIAQFRKYNMRIGNT